MQFFTLNKFKLLFLVIYASITIVAFLLAEIFDTVILNSIFNLLYSPAILLVNIPCLLSETICEGHSIIFNIISVPLFVISIFIFSFLLDTKGKKRNSSLKLGFMSLILFFIISSVGYEIVWEIGLPKLFNYSDWYIFLICLPVMFSAGYSIVYGSESLLRESKRMVSVLGILVSFLSLYLVITWIVGGACC